MFYITAIVCAIGFIASWSFNSVENMVGFGIFLLANLVIVCTEAITDEINNAKN